MASLSPTRSVGKSKKSSRPTAPRKGTTQPVVAKPNTSKTKRHTDGPRPGSKHSVRSQPEIPSLASGFSAISGGTEVKSSTADQGIASGQSGNPDPNADPASLLIRSSSEQPDVPPHDLEPLNKTPASLGTQPRRPSRKGKEKDGDDTKRRLSAKGNQRHKGSGTTATKNAAKIPGLAGHVSPGGTRSPEGHGLLSSDGTGTSPTEKTNPARRSASEATLRQSKTSPSSSAAILSVGKAGYAEPTERFDRRRRNRCACTAFGVVFALLVMSALTFRLASILMSRRQPRPVPRSRTVMGVFSRWAVVGHRECRNTTRNILRKNGTVGDVAVAMTLCMCVALPNRCSIGGGLFAVYYNAKEKKAYVVDGRETAPAAATWAFYEKTKRSRAATYVAIPGQMKALEALLNLTGTAVPWAELFHGAIELAHGGFAVGPELAAIIASKPDIGYTALSEIFWRKSKPLQAGDFVVQWQLADTLRKLAQRKASFYQGELARAIVSDLAHEGGVITEEDLASYEANVTEPISFPLAGGYTLLVPRPPAGGIYVGVALSVISRFLLEGTAPVSGDSMTAHRLVEALKFAFSRRSVLGDPKFFNMTQVIADAVSEETAAKIVSIIASHLGPSSEPSYYGQPFRGPLGFGTAHLGFLADNGDAVVVASSINSMFGSLVMSRRTGIIFNNDMLDFDLPHEFDQFNLSQTQRNQVSPRRRPLSSQSPCIVLQDGRGVAMLASGSGGGRIVSGIAQVIMRVLWMDQTVKEAVDAGRLHHQLVPDTLFIEDTVSEEIVDTLRFLGHSIDVQSSSPSDIMAMANRVGAAGEGKINAAYDYRRQTNDFVDGE